MRTKQNKSKPLAISLLKVAVGFGGRNKIKGVGKPIRSIASTYFNVSIRTAGIIISRAMPKEKSLL